MNSKKQRNIIICITAVVVAVFIGLGIDIEMKLYRLSQTDPVAVYLSETTSQQGGFDDLTHNYSDIFNQVSDQTSVNLSEYETDTTATVSETDISNTEVVAPDLIEGTSQPDAAPSDYTIVPESSVTSFDALQTTERTTAEMTQPTTKPSPTTVITVDADQNFYRTATGNKYHKADCSYLSKSKIKITVEEIISGGYSPCSRCVKEES